MTTKQKVAEIIAARDNMPVDCIIDQLDQMVEEMREAAEGDDWGALAPDVEGIWTDWTGLEPDYFVEFVTENL
jgi:hypothetical protein